MATRAAARGPAFVASAFLCVLSVASGCSRGCLTEQVQKGLTADPTGPAKAWFGVGELDCPDGLSRCVGGVVQTSLTARRPVRCTTNPEACACPWAVVASCSSGCVADGIEVFLPPARPVPQLCAASAAAAPYARLAGANAAVPSLGDDCEGESVVCLASAVVRCEPGPRLLGTCANGCSTEQGLVVANGLTEEQAMAILCSR